MYSSHGFALAECSLMNADASDTYRPDSLFRSVGCSMISTAPAARERTSGSGGRSLELYIHHADGPMSSEYGMP